MGLGALFPILLAAMGVYVLVGAIKGSGRLFSMDNFKDESKDKAKKYMRIIYFTLAAVMLLMALVNGTETVLYSNKLTYYRVTDAYKDTFGDLLEDGTLTYTATGTTGGMSCLGGGGTTVEKTYGPYSVDNQKMEIEAMVELAKKGVDGIHFDYIRYPDGNHCFCAGCRARFETMAGGAVTNWPGDVRKDERLRKLWLDFRTSNISFVVRTVSQRVRAEAPGVKISAAVFPSAETSPTNVGQDWTAWCRAGWLDFVCPMDYVESSALFRNQVAAQKRLVGKVPIYPGIGLSTWRHDGREAVRLAKQILAVRELGVEGFTVFNFDRRAEKVLPMLHLGITRDE